ncbi:MAG TPA: dipeptide epimerase [Planctomycetota bacterium]|jgi:L-alanine-DL-glutamate epimerase-like enolase superfamily enzyme
MKIHAQPLDLTLRHAFATSRSSSSVAHNVLVRIEGDGIEGFGEASPVRYYGQSQESCLKALQQMDKVLRRHDALAIEAVLAELKARFPTEVSARAAVDLALHDLLGKRVGLPLWKLFGLDPRKTPATSFTIGIDTLEKVVQKVGEAEEYPVLKIKVGVPGDVEIMREVRRLAPKKVLRVDANCGWTVKEAIEKARALEKLGVEFIEQPIPPGNNAALKRIKTSIGLPLLTDESSLVPEDVPPLRGCVDGINIKLVKCGGLREGLKMIHIARACGLKIMLGCMIESSVLISAAAQLSPLVDYADLDGNLLITDDPFRGVRINKQAKLLLPEGPGLGLTTARAEC